MAKKPYPSEEQDRFIIRFPDGMRDMIKEAANANGRSMNSEIIARLRDSFAPSSGGITNDSSGSVLRLHFPKDDQAEIFLKMLSGILYPVEKMNIREEDKK